jgi:hypothetical protein
MVIARKVAEAKIFEATPQQSDYVSLWSPNPSVVAPKPHSSTVKSLLAPLIPGPIKKPLKRLVSARSDAFQSDAFRRV